MMFILMNMVFQVYSVIQFLLSNMPVSFKTKDWENNISAVVCIHAFSFHKELVAEGVLLEWTDGQFGAK